MKRVIIIGAALVALAGAGTGVSLAATAGHHHGRHRCVTYDVWGQPANGMAWDEDLTFCGPAIMPETFNCPQGTGPAPGPGSTIYCTRNGHA